MMRPMPLRADRRSPLARAGRAFASLALLAAGLLLSGAFVGIAVRQPAVDREARTYQQQIDAELARRAELEAEVAQRQTDAYVIDKARDYGFVRPGEGLIAVESGPPGQTAAGHVPDAGRLARWLAFFFGAK